MAHGPDFDDVCRAELEEIAERRRELNRRSSRLDPDGEPGLHEPHRGEPGDPGNLVGLALSGGGIRSATFSLGVLQALAEARLLRLVDYLSTVSGGGFIGGCVSSLLNEKGASPDMSRYTAESENPPSHPFPLEERDDAPDTPAVIHLRNSGHYLAPGGFVERMRIPALLVRGVLLNALFLGPYLLLAVGATAALVHWSAEYKYVESRTLTSAGVLFLMLFLISAMVGGVALILGRAARRGRSQRSTRVDGLTHRAFLAAITTGALAAFCLGLPLWQDRSEPFAAVPAVAPLVFLVLVLTYPIVSHRVAGGGWDLRNRYEASMTTSFLAMLASIAMWPLFVLVGHSVWLTPADLWDMAQPALTLQWALVGVALVVAIAVGCALVPWVAQAVRRLALVVAGASPLAVVALYLVMCVMLIDPPFVGERRDTRVSPLSLAEVQVLDDSWGLSDEEMIGLFQKLHLVDGGDLLKATNMGVIAPGSAWMLAADILLKDQSFCHGLLMDQSFCHEEFLIAAREARAGGTVIQRWSLKDEWTSMTSKDWFLLSLAVGWLAFNTLFFNVNLTSAHSFYRDRISRAYLFRRDPNDSGKVALADRQALSAMNGEGTAAPYHLVNVALNVNSASEESTRGRNCDFFVFSKHYVGSHRTGYCRTTEMERVHPHLDLATAVAISGAAAAPNAGVVTNRNLLMLLTLLNVRLGYWLPNPRYLLEAQGWGAFWRKVLLRLGPGPGHLWREALGRVDTRGPFVNVSDGGHIENLGIYELLRRRCRLIIAVDGEQDEGMRFDGLLRLVLYASIDLGIKIDIDLNTLRTRTDKLRMRDSRLSESHYVVGRIEYADRQTGLLLYLKASMTGDEGEVLRDYRKSHPQFPHEPTSDQFFDERQFEMYRALGYHIGIDAVRRIARSTRSRGGVDHAFAEVYESVGEMLTHSVRKATAAGPSAAPATA